MEDPAKWKQQALMLIRGAVLAPSSHNTQPWLFRLSESVIDLLADRTRALPVNDPEDRELAISCGCALMNLRVATASLGLRLRVELFPDPKEPDWLAHATVIGDSAAPGAEAALSEFMAAAALIASVSRHAR